MSDTSMQSHINKMVNHTDLNPWYWLADGEKGYSFATVSAFPLKEGDPAPEPGSQLIYGDDGDWAGENGTAMMIDEIIAEIESQNGDVICSFIAAAHAHFLGKYIEQLTESKS